MESASNLGRKAVCGLKLRACDTLLRAQAETFGNGRAMRHLGRTPAQLITIEAEDIDAAIAVEAV